MDFVHATDFGTDFVHLHAALHVLDILLQHDFLRHPGKAGKAFETIHILDTLAAPGQAALLGWAGLGRARPGWAEPRRAALGRIGQG